MKKILIFSLMAFGMFATPVLAQNRTQKAKTTVAGKARKFWDNAKKSVQSTTEQIKDELGIDNTDHDALRRKYMPIYTDNLYKGGDANQLIQACREIFHQKYPSSYIQTSVIPQDTWKSEPVKEHGSIVGYLQSMYCYVLAKDGNDGYINAEFTFQRYKRVGEAYEHVEGKWPGMTRVDILTPEIYDKIKD